MNRFGFSILLALATIASCRSDTDSPAIGQPCSAASECPSGLCIEQADDSRVCTIECASDADCGDLECRRFSLSTDGEGSDAGPGEGIWACAPPS